MDFNVDLSRPLLDAKYEAIAQARARGCTLEEAHKLAGYKGARNRRVSCAGIIYRTPSIRARIAYLQSQNPLPPPAARIRDAIAKGKVKPPASTTAEELGATKAQLIADLLRSADDAEAAGSHNAALKARLAVARILGHQVSGTQTHEHVYVNAADRAAEAKRKATPAPDTAPEVPDLDPTERARLGKLLAEERQKQAEAVERVRAACSAKEADHVDG